MKNKIIIPKEYGVSPEKLDNLLAIEGKEVILFNIAKEPSGFGSYTLKVGLCVDGENIELEYHPFTNMRVIDAWRDESGNLNPETMHDVLFAVLINEYNCRKLFAFAESVNA